MATEKQIAANRLNALKSTGPKTEEGKKIVARNGISHGLFSGQPIDGESAEALEAYRATILREIQPATTLEYEQVEIMVRARWCQLRVWAMEDSALNVRIRALSAEPSALPATPAEMAARAFGDLADSSTCLQLLNRYETRFDRQYHRSLNKLLVLREKRENAIQSQF